MPKQRMTAPYGRAQAGGYLWRGGAGAASARVRIGRMAGSGPASGAARREHRDGSTAAAVRLHIPAVSLLSPSHQSIASGLSDGDHSPHWGQDSPDHLHRGRGRRGESPSHRAGSPALVTQSLRLPPARESPALSDGSPRVAYFHTQHTRGERGDGTRLAASGALVTNARGAAAMHASLVSEGEAERLVSEFDQGRHGHNKWLLHPSSAETAAQAEQRAARHSKQLELRARQRAREQSIRRAQFHNPTYMRRLRGPPGKSKPVRYTRVTASHSNPSVTFGGPVFKARALSEYQRRVPADHHLPEPLIAKDTKVKPTFTASRRRGGAGAPLMVRQVFGRPGTSPMTRRDACRSNGRIVSHPTTPAGLQPSMAMTPVRSRPATSLRGTHAALDRRNRARTAPVQPHGSPFDHMTTRIPTTPLPQSALPPSQRTLHPGSDHARRFVFGDEAVAQVRRRPRTHHAHSYHMEHRHSPAMTRQRAASSHGALARSDPRTGQGSGAAGQSMQGGLHGSSSTAAHGDTARHGGAVGSGNGNGNGNGGTSRRTPTPSELAGAALEQPVDDAGLRGSLQSVHVDTASEMMMMGGGLTDASFGQSFVGAAPQGSGVTESRSSTAGNDGPKPRWLPQLRPGERPMFPGDFPIQPPNAVTVWNPQYQGAVERVVDDVHGKVEGMLEATQQAKLMRGSGYRDRILMHAVKRQHMQQGRLGHPAPHIDRLAQRHDPYGELEYEWYGAGYDDDEYGQSADHTYSTGGYDVAGGGQRANGFGGPGMESWSEWLESADRWEEPMDDRRDPEVQVNARRLRSRGASRSRG